MWRTQRTGIASFLYLFVPFVMILLGSNEDKLSNVHLIVNWGMLARSELLSYPFVEEVAADGINKLYQICTFSLTEAVRKQGLSTLCIMFFSIMQVSGLRLFRKLRVSGRSKNSINKPREKNSQM